MFESNKRSFVLTFKETKTVLPPMFIVPAKIPGSLRATNTTFIVTVCPGLTVTVVFSSITWLPRFDWLIETTICVPPVFVILIVLSVVVSTARLMLNSIGFRDKFAAEGPPPPPPGGGGVTGGATSSSGIPEKKPSTYKSGLTTISVFPPALTETTSADAVCREKIAKTKKNVNDKMNLGRKIGWVLALKFAVRLE